MGRCVEAPTWAAAVVVVIVYPIIYISTLSIWSLQTPLDKMAIPSKSSSWRPRVVLTSITPFPRIAVATTSTMSPVVVSHSGVARNASMARLGSSAGSLVGGSCSDR